MTVKPKKIYLVGIKGTGMSSLAVILKKMGHQVTGSDTPEKFFTESQLHKNNIKFWEGFDENNVIKAAPDLVIFSTAYNQNHPEIASAKKAKIKAISYPEAVGWISKHLTSIAIAGSHGKTTTTAMLGSIMQSNRRTVTLTGTVADQLDNKVKKPAYFIFEADEYQNKFEFYNPPYLILTNVDFDHPDYFKSKKHYLQTFQAFVAKILKNGGTVLYGYDSSPARAIFKKLSGKISSYGFHPKSDYQIQPVNVALHQFSVFHDNKELFSLHLTVYGKHNIMNASAAAIMAARLGVPAKVIRPELKNFTGVKRRMEMVPSEKYVIIDDYGHHPAEIQATLAAVRNRYPKQNLVAVFHPHTFTRTKTFLKDFGRSFKDADLTIVLDIYGSARETRGTIHAREVVKEIQKNKSKAVYQPTVKEAAAYIKKSVALGSLILTIGAGDVWKLTDLIK